MSYYIETAEGLTYFSPLARQEAVATMYHYEENTNLSHHGLLELSDSVEWSPIMNAKKHPFKVVLSRRIAECLPSDLATSDWRQLTATVNQICGDEVSHGTVLRAAAMTLAYRDVTRAVTESAPSHLSETLNAEVCLGPLVDLESELSAPADWSIETKAFTLNAWAENAAIGDMERVFGIDAWRGNQTWQGAVARFIELDENTPTPIFGRPCHVVLKEPADHFPTDLGEQLEWVMEHWDAYLSEETRALYLLTKDVEAEFYAARFGGGGPAQFSRLDTDIGALDGMNLVSQDAGEDTVGYVDARPRFSDDADWMPRLVMMAKQSYVWLHQLSQQYGRPIERLDQIPEAELACLAKRGFSGLWLIGLWERSPASKAIKVKRGNPEAASSAYALKGYRIADRLGGEAALNRLREKATRCGLRLAADMVPNHMGMDSDWLVDNPDWFLQLSNPPYPGYTFNGPDVSGDSRVSIHLEDGYWNESDAAVVFKCVHRDNGQTRYIYHGNDGTQMPWNDTAQLDYLKPQVREAVIQTILDVARRFPVIRFDAAMTLARKHIARLWYPPPGHGGAIPSRAENSVPQHVFDEMVPGEFWREVVERVKAEVPDTLLLAEAFWMMEGYFVRTLGMHRVYNSAFMHMLRDEDNAGYRAGIRGVLEYSPAILERYVNFMNNPDEETAIEQFGSGDKYFGIATMMATLPGLPMFGHGQVEGFSEKYGMEYTRAYRDESVNEGLVAHHERVIFPLLRRRDLFSSVQNFVFFDFGNGHDVNENVFAFANQSRQTGEHSLVLYNNGYERAEGQILSSTPINVGDVDSPRLEQRSFADAIGITGDDSTVYGLWDLNQDRWLLRTAGELRNEGLRVELNGYQAHVFAKIVNLSAQVSSEHLQSLLARAGRQWVAPEELGPEYACLDDYMSVVPPTNHVVFAEEPSTDTDATDVSEPSMASTVASKTDAIEQPDLAETAVPKPTRAAATTLTKNTTKNPSEEND